MSGATAETAAWTEAYASPELSRRRERTYLSKLGRLGLLEPVDGWTVDVACGHGDALRLLRQQGQRRLAGLDLDLPSPLADGAAPVRGNGTVLPFATASVRRVMCLHALHHFRSLEDIGDFLTECRRLLTPAGRLYLLDHWGSPWLRGLFHVLEWRCPLYPAAARHFGAQLREEHDAIFWWLDTWRSLFGLLASAGFRVERQSRSPAFLYLTCCLDDGPAAAMTDPLPQ